MIKIYHSGKMESRDFTTGTHTTHYEKLVRVGVKFRPRDFWIGIFIDKEKEDKGSGDFVQRIYVCLIPCLPIIVERWLEGP